MKEKEINEPNSTDMNRKGIVTAFLLAAGLLAEREEQYNLAAYILDRKFPIRRRPSSEIPPMQAEGIRTFRNFDAINLLFRPDKLLEAYQRRRDEPVRGAEFHLKRH